MKLPRRRKFPERGLGEAEVRVEKRLAERARALASARAFFEGRGYLEVETPVLVPSPGLDVHLDAFQVGGRYLSTSPEYQMKRLLAHGHPRLYQITRAFRAGEMGERHNPEFTILEFYRSGDVEGILRDTEQLVARITGGTVTLDGRAIDARPPFERLPLVEAFARWAGIAEDETLRLAREDEDAFFRKLAFEVEPGLRALDRAVFVVDYPASQASLARTKPSDSRYAERFELYVGGIELCNGFGELVDAEIQRQRLVQDRATRARIGKPVYPIDERFLAALPQVPPCAGNAIGFDRLVSIACGTRSIGEVIAFTDAEL
jgi:elongation factor P--(R)-beta-lysine ligase